MKVELAIMIGALERFVELSAKDVTEHLDGKKEIVAWFDPARVIGRQSTGWHHAMNMWVGREFLTPGMQNTEEADFCTEVFGIAGHFEESFCTGAKQEIVEDLLVLQDQRGQMTRKREDHMDVARWEKLLATCCVHVVFTLPRHLAPLVLQNKKVLYDLLFRTSAETLLEVARDPQHLGAEIGFFSVLHTWSQKLTAHPHVHCVVPVGGLSANGTRWITPRYDFFLPVK